MDKDVGAILDLLKDIMDLWGLLSESETEEKKRGPDMRRNPSFFCAPGGT